MRYAMRRQHVLHQSLERSVADTKTPSPEKQLSAADAAKLVKRRTVVVDGDAEKVITKPIAAKEVLDFRDYGTHVVVVTTDGQKFSSAEAEAA